MKRALVLRPEPGNAATAARLAAAGMPMLRCPLFAIRPLAWTPPEPSAHDALLLSSANAARCAGPALARYAGLPVLAVGQATAAAAEAEGLPIAMTGEADAAALVCAANARGWRRLLHLTGRDHVTLPGVTAVPVYASEALPIAVATVRAWSGSVALLHSVRAARRCAALVDQHGDRRAIGVAALSGAVAKEAGAGWAASTVALQPTDAALFDAVRGLIDRAEAAADKPDA